MRKVLMIAYGFPPRGGSGVQRTVKFAKYLPEFGWERVILTVSNPPLDEADPSLLEELPSDLEVYRMPNIALHNIVGFIRSLIDKRERDRVKIESRNLEIGGPVISRLLKVLANFAKTCILIPDPAIGWFPAAILAGWRILKQSNIDVIYSTSGPLTDHLVACLLRKLSGKPWIADFRDPWTQYVQYQRSSGVRKRIEEALEWLVLRSADKVIVTCWPTAQGFLTKYPHLDANKFLEITNGFDPEDFREPSEKCSAKLVITYTGRFNSKKNSSSYFLQALRSLVAENSDFKDGVEVIFAGLFGQRNFDLLGELQLDGIVRPLGYVAHRDSIRYLLGSDVLLLTLNAGEGTENIYPGKLFEYLAARKLILALVTEGATADFIQEMDAGIVVPPDDVEAIEMALRKLYDQYQRGELAPKSYSDLHRFERKHLTWSLVKQLDLLTDARRGGARYD